MTGGPTARERISNARRKKRRLRLLLALVVSAAFVAVVIYRSLHVAGYRCELCLSFKGQRVCRAVEGSTEAEARSAALNNACAVLAAGVTETLACERTEPDTIRCTPID